MSRLSSSSTYLPKSDVLPVPVLCPPSRDARACLSSLVSDKDEFLFDVTPGPTFGVAVVAWLLGLAGAIVSWALLSRATTEQDGPFGACMSKMGAANAGGAPPAGQPGVPVATV